MIEIKSTLGRVLYVAKTATDVRTALGEAVVANANLAGANLADADLTRANLANANLAGANLADADLTRANLAGANLAGANLTRANLAGAYLAGAYLTGAYLTRANLTGANLTRANLTRANLTRANLTGAVGIRPELSNDLLLLQHQVGKIRAFKLVDSAFRSPIQTTARLTYAVGTTVTARADVDEQKQCAAGVNVATLPWCLRYWQPGYHIMLVEFTAKDIAAIPLGDGKFRLHRCKVIREYKFDPVELGLAKA